MVGIGHLKGGVRGLQPPRRGAPPTLLLACVHVLEGEVSTCRLRDHPDGVALVSGPAAEVEDDTGSANEHFVGHPNHPALKDVAATISVALTEERRHPLVGCQAQDPVGRGQLLRAVGRRSVGTAVRLEYVTIGWNAIEAAVAVGSGVVAGSVALVAFGLDSAIEVVSATIVLVHLRAALAGTEPNPARHRRALRTIAVTFFALAAYVTVDAAISLLRTDRPSASTLGLAVTGAP